jgi:ABC-2 type transport system ATP-binding protein
VGVAIQASKLTKQYSSQKGNPALEGLDLSINPGQIFGLIGADGAGKTTALRILSTVLEQSSGEARIHEFDTRRKAERVRGLIGYMPQAFSLYPDLSVIENLHFFADLNRVPRALQKERIASLLEFARLERFQSRRSAHLSGGMRKKLALACALVHDPKVLLLDEPTTGVDPVSRRELWVILAKVVQKGMTILISTPYMDEAERCHRVAILHHGKLLAQGHPAELEGSLPFDVVEVKARPRKAMRNIVDNAAGVQAWRPVGDRLRLSVPNGNGGTQPVMDGLRADFGREQVEVEVLKETRKSMEDVFVYLVSEQRSDA